MLGLRNLFFVTVFQITDHAFAFEQCIQKADQQPLRVILAKYALEAEIRKWIDKNFCHAFHRLPPCLFTFFVSLHPPSFFMARTLSITRLYIWVKENVHIILHEHFLLNVSHWVNIQIETCRDTSLARRMRSIAA